MAKRDRRPPRKGWLPGRAIGTIQPTKKELDSIDCVLAEVERGARVKSRFPTPIGRLDATPVAEKEIRVESTRPDDGLKVQIYGAVSRHSTGYARLGLSISIRSRRGKVRIDPPLIEISPAYETSLDFCRKGDSGALVVTSGGANGPRPLGILVARARGAKMAAMGYAVPIERVIDAIGDGATIHRG
ncbi:MAG: hypothetical protein GY716_19630 [bacterium]|nr:hypothetical protein [bacterium]